MSDVGGAAPIVGSLAAALCLGCCVAMLFPKAKGRRGKFATAAGILLTIFIAALIASPNPPTATAVAPPHAPAHREKMASAPVALPTAPLSAPEPATFTDRYVDYRENAASCDAAIASFLSELKGWSRTHANAAIAEKSNDASANCTDAAASIRKQPLAMGERPPTDVEAALGACADAYDHRKAAMEGFANLINRQQATGAVGPAEVRLMIVGMNVELATAEANMRACRSRWTAAAKARSTSLEKINRAMEEPASR